MGLVLTDGGLIEAIKNVKYFNFSGVRLDLVRNVSRHFQMKHTLQLGSKSSQSPKYVNITQFDSDFTVSLSCLPELHLSSARSWTCPGVL